MKFHSKTGCTALESEQQSSELYEEIQRRLSVLEERNLELVEEARRVEGEKRFVEGELIRLQKELKRLKAELERLKAPPLIIGQIKDVL
ncbi:MAG: proteasome-activating nucleotidase, partial [Methanobacteriota archaeon]